MDSRVEPEVLVIWEGGQDGVFISLNIMNVLDSPFGNIQTATKTFLRMTYELCSIVTVVLVPCPSLILLTSPASMATHTNSFIQVKDSI